MLFKFKKQRKVEDKKNEKRYYTNTNQSKSGIVRLISDKVDFEGRSIARN